MIETPLHMMITPLLATVSQEAPLAEGISLMVVGMSVVFAALSLVGLALLIIRKYAVDPPPPAVPESKRPTAKPVAAARQVSGEIDERTIAILTAAAMAVVGGPVRVRRMQFLQASTDGSWAASGRSMIHGSHNIQHRKQ